MIVSYSGSDRSEGGDRETFQFLPGAFVGTVKFEIHGCGKLFSPCICFALKQDIRLRENYMFWPALRPVEFRCFSSFTVPSLRPLHLSQWF